MAKRDELIKVATEILAHMSDGRRTNLVVSDLDPTQVAIGEAMKLIRICGEVDEEAT